MAFGDLANQGESQPDAAVRTGLAGRTVEGLENTLSLRFWNTRPAIGDDEADTAGLLARLDHDRNLSVSQGILEQVPDETSEKLRITVDQTTDAANFDALESGRFLGREHKQVDPFTVVDLLRCVESTRNEQFSDQLVQLLDISVDASQEVRTRILMQKRDRHAHTSQRRT